MYIFRHSALTEKSQILKEHVLRDHAGWTMTSKMPQVYIHYFGTESSRSLLEARGIIKEKDHRVFQLRPKQCPNCNEPNKPDSKFCKHCRMVLSYDAYEETIQEQRQKDQKLERLEKTQLEMIEMLKIMVRNDNSPEALERRKKFETRAAYGKLFMEQGEEALVKQVQHDYQTDAERAAVIQNMTSGYKKNQKQQQKNTTPREII